MKLLQCSIIRPLKNHWQYGLLWVIVGLTILVGCATPTPEVSPIGDTESDAYRSLFYDAFSPADPAWARYDTPESAAYAQDGEFFLEDRGMGIAAYVPLVGQSYDNITLKVQIRHVQGTVNNWMGVICQQQDENNYYLFAISADGYYLILRVEDNESVALVGPEASDAINVGKTTNVMEAGCHHNVLSLQINGTQLVTVEDDVFATESGVALFADAIEPGEMATVAFDDFEIVAP